MAYNYSEDNWNACLYVTAGVCQADNEALPPKVEGNCDQDFENCRGVDKCKDAMMRKVAGKVDEIDCDHVKEAVEAIEGSGGDTNQNSTDNSNTDGLPPKVKGNCDQDFENCRDDDKCKDEMMRKVAGKVDEIDCDHVKEAEEAIEGSAGNDGQDSSIALSMIEKVIITALSCQDDVEKCAGSNDCGTNLLGSRCDDPNCAQDLEKCDVASCNEGNCQDLQSVIKTMDGGA